MDGLSGDTHVVPSVVLESVEVMTDVTVKYKTWGTLNAAGDNAIFVCHALTGNHELDAWWADMLGPGKPFDSDKYFVVCANMLGSCYGTTGPASPDPRKSGGEPYGADFPEVVTIRDNVDLFAATLRDALGVTSVAAVIGGSMGGMVALEWCYRTTAPAARSAVLLATNGRHSAWQIGVSALQRQAIFADPKYNGGRYDPNDPPTSGLAVARQIAMVSYRTHNAYETKFGRRLAGVPEDGEDGDGEEGGGQRLGDRCRALYDVEGYLTYVGEEEAARPLPLLLLLLLLLLLSPLLLRLLTNSLTLPLSGTRARSSSTPAPSTPTRTWP